MRKQMKKIGTVLLAAAMTFGLVGCGPKRIVQLWQRNLKLR